MPKTTKKCITYVVQPENAGIASRLSLSLSLSLGSSNPKPDGEPEPLLCLGELWPHALGSGHKKQFSGTHKEREAEAAAITITCFVINYSLRNAGDRPKTTTVTVTQGSRLVGCLDG